MPGHDMVACRGYVMSRHVSQHVSHYTCLTRFLLYNFADKRFLFLCNRILSHVNEEQLFMRVRWRLGLEPADMFIEPGVAGRRNASYEDQLVASSQDQTCPLLASASADLEASNADSINRHLW
jgi:hypothetical protein